MDKKTAVDYLIDQLLAPCRGIPSHIIEEAKRLEKEQVINDYLKGDSNGCGCYDYATKKDAEEYYNKTYGNGK